MKEDGVIQQHWFAISKAAVQRVYTAGRVSEMEMCVAIMMLSILENKLIYEQTLAEANELAAMLTQRASRRSQAAGAAPAILSSPEVHRHVEALLCKIAHLWSETDSSQYSEEATRLCKLLSAERPGN